jgi:hypothetical protein
VIPLKPAFVDVPVRPKRVAPDIRLIDVFGRDAQLSGLCQFLYQELDVLTIGELDAVGWTSVDRYGGKLTRRKRDRFFKTIGRPQRGLTAPVLLFRRPSAI